MYKKLLLGLSAVLLTTTLTGCSQVHFGRDAITIGENKKIQPKIEHKNKQINSKKKAAASSKKPVKKTIKKVKKIKNQKEVKKVVKTSWNADKTKKLQTMMNKWSRPTGQVYRFYDGVHSLKTKNGDTYPRAFTQATFVLNKKPIKIGWTPVGKNKYQYNVVAIANDNFKSWHNTYLFCLKNKKPVILLDQSKKGGSVIVRTVKEATLNKGFEKVYQK